VNIKDGGNYPVELVSWDDICNSGGFLEKLNVKTGKKFRLPTEAEWEYAARGGTHTRFYWGDDPSYALINNNAWYVDNSISTTHPVGEKTQNAFGLYDMSGNVWEWCNDWYGTYPGGSVTDPPGPATGLYRVIRGGCWFHDAADCRSAIRNNPYPSNRLDIIGFRLAFSLA